MQSLQRAGPILQLCPNASGCQGRTSRRPASHHFAVPWGGDPPCASECPGCSDGVRLAPAADGLHGTEPCGIGGNAATRSRARGGADRCGATGDAGRATGPAPGARDGKPVVPGRDRTGRRRHRHVRAQRSQAGRPDHDRAVRLRAHEGRQEGQPSPRDGPAEVPGRDRRAWFAVRLRAALRRDVHRHARRRGSTAAARRAGVHRPDQPGRTARRDQDTSSAARTEEGILRVRRDSWTAYCGRYTKRVWFSPRAEATGATP